MSEQAFKLCLKSENKFYDDTFAVTESGFAIIVDQSHVGASPDYVFLPKDDYVILRYTGLRDKNDKGIYEGYVIKWNGGKTESRSKMQVVWANEHAQYILLAFREDWCFELGSCLQGTLEIVGNIYENPELLEVEQ